MPWARGASLGRASKRNRRQQARALLEGEKIELCCPLGSEFSFRAVRQIQVKGHVEPDRVA